MNSKQILFLVLNLVLIENMRIYYQEKNNSFTELDVMRKSNI